MLLRSVLTELQKKHENETDAHFRIRVPEFGPKIRPGIVYGGHGRRRMMWHQEHTTQERGGGRKGNSQALALLDKEKDTIIYRTIFLRLLYMEFE